MTGAAPEPSPSGQLLENELRRIIAARSTIASVLRENASNYIGPQHWAMQRLSQFFDVSQLTSAELLQHPEAFAVCLPLMKSTQSPRLNPSPETIATGEGEFSRQQIAVAVRVGCDRVCSATRSAPRVLSLIAYPVLLVLMTWAILVFFSFQVIPVFERMFDEFGLDLPPLTNAVISVSHWVQDGWWLVLLLIGAVLSNVLLERLTATLDPRSRYRYGAIEKWMTSARTAWAEWAWHIAMLIEAGLPQSDAVAIAGNASSKSWLARCSNIWAGELRRGVQPFDSMTHMDGNPINTLTFALRLPRAEDQVAILHDVSANYHDWESSRRRWWVDWITPVTVSLIAFCIGATACSLFMPLISLISGLT